MLYVAYREYIFGVLIWGTGQFPLNMLDAVFLCSPLLSIFCNSC